MLSPLLLLVVFALALLGWAAVRRVPEGQVYTVRRLDGHLRTVGSGTRFMLPLVERVARKTRLTGASTTVDGLADADGVWRAQVWYQLLDARAVDMVPRLDDLVRNATRDAFAALPVREADAARVALKQALNAQLRQHGVLVARVELSGSA